MANNHYKKNKIEETLKILEKALELLVVSKENIVLNKKKYYKINFSLAQIINAMNEVATFEQKELKLVIKDASTLSKNLTYQKLINEAKLERARLQLGDLKSLENEESASFDYVKLQHKYDELDYRYKLLLSENNNLKKIIKIADIQESLLDDHEKKVVTIESEDLRRFKRILTDLLNATYNDFSIMIDDNHNIVYTGSGTVLLCKTHELSEITDKLDFQNKLQGV